MYVVEKTCKTRLTYSSGLYSYNVKTLQTLVPHSKFSFKVGTEHELTA